MIRTVWISERLDEHREVLARSFNFRDPRFFVEVKKPNIDIATRDNYFQAIRYGWNSQNPLVILTNFQQIHVLDCRYKPDIDTVLTRCVRRYSFADLAQIEKFSELYYLIGHDAVASGALEEFAALIPRPTGKAVQRGLFELRKTTKNLGDSVQKIQKFGSRR